MKWAFQDYHIHTKWGLNMVLSLLPRPPQPLEETGPVRTDWVQKKKPQRPPLPHKRNSPAIIGMDSSHKVPVVWLSKPFSGPLWLVTYLLG